MKKRTDLSSPEQKPKSGNQEPKASSAQQKPKEDAPEIKKTEETPAPKSNPAPSQPTKLTIEQVALANEKKMSPRFKPQHLVSILAFCKSTGLPTSGSEKEMLNVLRRYGYKI